MRILGIDYGDSRIGISMSDPLGWTAQGIQTIVWKGRVEEPIEKVVQLVKEYKVDKIVIGFPKNMNGTIGPRGEKTLEFITFLQEHLQKMKFQHVEIIKWDERLTTVAANRAMREMGVRTSKKKGIVDQIAAVYILQGYLDSISGKII